MIRPPPRSTPFPHRTLSGPVIASNAAGPSAPARSAQSAVVAQAPQPPASIAPPTIAGEAREGQTLTATAGEWSGAPTSFAYQGHPSDPDAPTNIAGQPVTAT